MEEEAMDPQDVEMARTFWAEEDVDQVFHRVSVYLDHLRRVLKKNTARDRELVLAWKLLQSLDLSPSSLDPTQDSSVVQVVIGSGKLLPADSSHHSPPYSPPHGPSSSASSLADREEAPAPGPRLYQPHPCTRACLPSLPSMPQSTLLFWAQNPLKVPLRCGFKWLNPVPLKSSEVSTKQEEDGAQDVVYKAPCGKSLCNHDDVMHFLLATETYDILQVDFFTFNTSVRLDRPAAPGPRRPELDLSRGLEPTPVELCTGDGGVRPADFRYRRDRWPHGCFLSRAPTLFHACCDCTDGCTDAQRCACIRMTRGGRGYTHHRLTEPIPSGVYECGPWCGCDRARCQNRLVQRGIRVRLQVFQTDDRGWGVRCRDDLDRGTFVCIYAGVILQRVVTPLEPQPPKLVRYDLPSDDDVEVVTEWLAPPVLEGRSNLVETPPSASPPLHVPVIQRPADASSPAPQAQTVLMGRPEPASPSGDRGQEKLGGPEDGVNEKQKRNHRSLKRAAQVEEVYLLDASKEGNVSRFFNHSCRPNLFIQKVFTDSHDSSFPVIAFFTSRVLRAGTELTWNYSAHAASQEQEVTCLCGSDGCQGWFTVDENLCHGCEVKGQRAVVAQ